MKRQVLGWIVFIAMIVASGVDLLLKDSFHDLTSDLAKVGGHHFAHNKLLVRNSSAFHLGWLLVTILFPNDPFKITERPLFYEKRTFFRGLSSCYGNEDIDAEAPSCILFYV